MLFFAVERLLPILSLSKDAAKMLAEKDYGLLTDFYLKYFDMSTGTNWDALGD